MARRRAYHRRDLPPNLYERNNGYYTYRDPRDGREHKLGRNKRLAITEAIAANMALYSTQPSLVDRINGVHIITVSEWVEKYQQIVINRNLRANTLRDYKSKLKTISLHFNDTPLQSIATKHIADFLNNYVSAGKAASAKIIRSTLLDFFREAMAAGYITSNPVEATKNPRLEVKRERLTFKEYSIIRKQAEKHPAWFGLSMDIALITGQRLGDIKKMSWTDIREDKLWVAQEKTGMKLAIPISLKLESANLCLSQILNLLRGSNNKNGKLIKGSRLSSLFRKVRDESGISWENNPPSFHEIRSLAARLYTDEKGGDFAQKLLGHKSSSMTDKYRDQRGKEWVIINK